MAALRNDPKRDQLSKQSDIKKKNFCTLEFSLKERVHKDLVSYCLRNSLTFEDGASSLIDRGIDNYWLMKYKFLKHDFAVLNNNFEVYKKDNELLTAIEAQNEELKSQLLKKGVFSPVLAMTSKKGPSERAGKTSGAKELASQDEKSEWVMMSLVVKDKTAEKLNQFLLEKGFFVADAIPVLIEYGLASQDENALRVLKEERENELPKLDAKYAVLRFQTYQCFKVNQTIVFRLHILLSENRRLKELCQKHGILDHGMRDEWDDWGPEKIDELYGRYVFINMV